MVFFYIAVLFILVYLTYEQLDQNNWDNLNRYYKELREKENKKL